MIEKKFLRLKNFLDQKNYLDKKMDIARRIFNDQHPATCLIDLFGKRYKIDENDKVFRWLCLNKESNYLTYMRICKLADHCCVLNLMEVLI